jgi:hypothetical protein
MGMNREADIIDRPGDPGRGLEGGLELMDRKHSFCIVFHPVLLQLGHGKALRSFVSCIQIYVNEYPITAAPCSMAGSSAAAAFGFSSGEPTPMTVAYFFSISARPPAVLPVRSGMQLGCATAWIQ